MISLEDVVAGATALVKGGLIGYGAYCAATKTKTGKSITSGIKSTTKNGFAKVKGIFTSTPEASEKRIILHKELGEMSTFELLDMVDAMHKIKK